MSIFDDPKFRADLDTLVRIAKQVSATITPRNPEQASLAAALGQTADEVQTLLEARDESQLTE
jgi:hypothetical protein